MIHEGQFTFFDERRGHFWRRCTRLMTFKGHLKLKMTKEPCDPDVIRTRSLLIWSQTRYRCATESAMKGSPISSKMNPFPSFKPATPLHFPTEPDTKWNGKREGSVLRREENNTTCQKALNQQLNSVENDNSIRSTNQSSGDKFAFYDLDHPSVNVSYRHLVEASG